MAHHQIIRQRIEGKDCTLHYDYDQIDNRILSHLSPDGRVEWFEQRMQFVFLEPLKALYGGRTRAHRALNSTKDDDLPARSFVVATFSVLLNGVEALGSFLVPASSNKERFRAFLKTYMPAWNVRVAISNSPYATNDLADILWTHFRNGIAHGFCIEGGGIDDEADATNWLIVPGRLAIGPHAFFEDFLTGADRFFADAKTVHRAAFLERFRKVYPH